MIAANYFDGQTSRRHAVTLMIHRGIVAFSGGEVRGSVKLSKVIVSEPLEHAPRLFRLPDGGLIEASHPGLDRLLRKNGYRESRVVRWQRRWPRSLGALVSLLAVLIAGYQWGLPWAADTVAQHMPHTLEQRIGDEGLALIDAGYMEPSSMTAEEQEHLRKRFASLHQPRGEKTPYRLEFRRSKMGPNAFALPNGVIVMTDELVRLAPDEEAILGVLGHELGHLQRRHSMRRLLQALSVGTVVNLVIGDVSSVLAAMPTFLLDQKYSRDFEREADQYAIDMMRANRLTLAPMAALFQRLGDGGANSAIADKKAEASDGGDDRDTAPAPKRGRRAKRKESFDYLSSHPSDAERIARLRAADAP